MEFVIPLDKNDLLQNSNEQYYVKELISSRCIPQALDDTRIALQENGPDFIFKHFDDFFSIIIHGKKLDASITIRGLDRIIKAIKLMVDDYENDGLDNDREKKLRMLKMYMYLLSNIMCHLENATYELDDNNEFNRRKKKNAKTSDIREEWETRRDPILLTIYRLLQLPLQKLWRPPIVEESFVMLVADICYKILENDKDLRQQSTRLNIWQILGTLVQRYMHAMTCAIKIIQLVRLDDGLAPTLAAGVVSMVTECNCPSFITKIANEIEESNLEEAEARNISLFIENIASTRAELILPILNNIIDYLDNDSYVLRNCAVSTIGFVILSVLNGENLTKKQRDMRDECFDCLSSSVLDINAYVRSKVFQTWQKLCCEGAIPLSQFSKIIKTAVPHLKEKSAVVRKQTLQLMRTLLQCNPFGGVLNKVAYIEQRDKTELKLRELQNKVVTESKSCDDERIALWRELTPQIQKALAKFIIENDKNKNDIDKVDENNEIDGNSEFEKIRQLIVDRKFTKAIERLINVCGILEYTPDMADMENDEKEQCYLLFLLKIFLESEQDRESDKEKFKSVEWKKRKGEIQAYRRAINCFDNSIIFITELEESIPIIEMMLYAAAPAVAIEACTFLGTAYQFKVVGSATTFHKSLSQVFSREESVRSNVATIYKDMYLKSEKENVSNRQAAMAFVNGLIQLYKGLKPGQSPALAQLITIFLANNDLDDMALQIMWEKYSSKIPGTTQEDSRCAIALLSMVAQSQPKIITANLATLIKIGFQTQENNNILFARDTCRALMKIRSDTDDTSIPPIKYPNDYELIQEIKSLLIKRFENCEKMSYVSFATEAINVIYHLANNPGLLMKEILQQISVDSADIDVPMSHLAKLLYIVGHISICHMVHLDTAVYKELKRRNAIRDGIMGKKKANKLRESAASAHSSARKARRSIHRKASIQDDDEENHLDGASANDIEAEIIDETLEDNIVTGNGLLAIFVPLVKDVCQYPEKYNEQCTQTWGVLALSKMMTVSSKFCKDNLQLLITILERSTYPAIRSNILIGLSDLMVRFPNDVEPWTNYMYSRLRDNEVIVRRTAVQVLSNLVKREMIRVKGQSAELTLCIVDNDEKIQNDVKQFFQELSQKGNVLYNIIPDILSRLTSDDINIDENDLHTIFKYIFGLLHKEREIDSLLDKICVRFKLATTERQWRDLSYCLSLLQLGKKGIARLIVHLPLLKDKIHNKQVQKAFKDIIDVSRKKPDLIDICNSLEDEIEKLMDNLDLNNANVNNDKDRDAMPPPINLPKKRTTIRKTKAQSSSSDDEDDDDYDNNKDENEYNTTNINDINHTMLKNLDNNARIGKRKSARLSAINNSNSSLSDDDKSNSNLRDNDKNSSKKPRGIKSKKL